MTQEGRAISTLIRDGSEAALAAARARLAEVSGDRTALEVAQLLDISQVTLRQWGLLVTGALPPRATGPTPPLVDIRARMSRGDTHGARLVLEVALEPGIEAASRRLGISVRELKKLISVLELELPRGRPLSSPDAAPIKAALYSQDGEQRKRGVELMRRAVDEAGSVKEAAALLGISYRTLLGWRKRFGA